MSETTGPRAPAERTPLASAVKEDRVDAGGVERAAEWVYRGVWKSISSLFKVPTAPPELPTLAGDTPRSFHPSRSYLRYLKLYFWIAALAIDVLIAVAWLAIFLANRQLGALLALPALAIAVLPDILAYVAIHLKYDTMWYVMNARSLRCRRGIWTIIEHTITFENVQNVAIQRGPVQHLYGIWTIVIETAGATEPEGESHFAVGNKAIMDGIANPHEIRDLIMERVRKSRGTGIGELPQEERAPSPMWTPSHVRVLGEIRDAVKGCGGRASVRRTKQDSS